MLIKTFYSIHPTYLRIRANGGKIVQIAKNQPGLLVVYGGSTTREYVLQLARGV